ncbi:transposase, partial [Schleiferilactobacillus shenzhenensis]|uniref:transposase n=1 Tax=Schleiferilactobacillus shenzhenensis TaxID=1231337 RepID=UPI00058AD1DA
RIIPQHGRFLVEVVYPSGIAEIVYQPDNGRYLTIDPGVDNAFAMATNVPGLTPWLINGKPLKAVNQLYNKTRSRLVSVHKLSGQNYTSRRLDNVEYKRDRKIDKFAHEASRRIVAYALSHELNTIVIGS